jgi:hypothetical protein
VCACQSDDSTKYVDHNGANLVQNGALVDLQEWLQEA